MEWDRRKGLRGMKKLIDTVEGVVPDALAGLVESTNGLALVEGTTTVVRTDFEDLRDAGKVALISGGGSGHEPAHAGFVGPGLLTAAVAGDVFASPSTDAVLTAIRTVCGSAGVLLIVKNYTGDRLNFGLAAQIARAEGIDVEIVIVDDDAALGSAEETAGRRGVAGTILVHKVAGAAAARGATLAEVKASAEAAIGAIASMGVALSSCTVPAAGVPNFELGPDEIEIGLGIHGEQGRERVTLRSAASLSEHLISQIVHDRGLGQGDEVALLVNNLGTTPPIELAIVTRGALAACRAEGLKVRRVWSGTFLTSLDMAGISLSLMRLDADRLDALDAEACAPGWTPPAKDPASRTVPAPQSDEAAETRHGPAVSSQFIAALEAGCRALIDAEPELTKLDQVTGDGDIGRSLAGGAEAILAATDELADLSEPDALRRIGQIIRARTGGTSGPLYAIFAFGAGEALRDATDRPAAERLELGFAAGLDALAALGGAAPGDRTMIDALAPAAKAMAGEGGAIQRLVAGAEAAAQGAGATADMQARRGRSSYLGERVVGHRDPGAEAVARALAAAATAVEGDRP